MDNESLAAVTAIGGVIIGSLLSALWQLVESRRRRAEATAARLAAEAAELRTVRRAQYGVVLAAARATTNLYDADFLDPPPRTQDELDNLVDLIDSLALIAGVQVLAQAERVREAVDEHWVARSLVISHRQHGPRPGEDFEARSQDLSGDFMRKIEIALAEIQRLFIAMRSELGLRDFDEDPATGLIGPRPTARRARWRRLRAQDGPLSSGR